MFRAFIVKYFRKYFFKILFINLIKIYIYFISKHIYIYIDFNNNINCIYSIKFFKLLIYIIRIFMKKVTNY